MCNAHQNRAYCLFLYRSQHIDIILALRCTDGLKYTTALFISAEVCQHSKCLNLVTWSPQDVVLFFPSTWPLYASMFVFSVCLSISIETQYRVLCTVLLKSKTFSLAVCFFFFCPAVTCEQLV